MDKDEKLINPPPAVKPEWLPLLAPFEKPDRSKAGWQLLNTLIPYLACWVLMIWLIRQDAPWWTVALLSLTGGTLLVRIFIFFHDCCHGSFLASRRANRLLGYITGLLTFTPFEEWRQAHATHHVTAGDLDRRGTGDIWTLTVDEYQASSRWQRLAYRLYRHPLVMFVLGPVFVFLIQQRFPKKSSGKPAWRSVIVTDAGLLAILILMSITIGWKTYLLIQLPMMIWAGLLGVWLFYVQHQFAGVYWARHQDWSPVRAALDGSSYYRLPRFFQWITGNIGLHHIHHLRPRIPNYHLQRCYDAVPALQQVKPVRFLSSLGCLALRVWDEKRRQLVSLRSMKVTG